MLGCSVTDLPTFDQALNRRQHPTLAAAAAEIGVQSFLYVYLCGMGVIIQQGGRRNNNARCTKPALSSTFIDKGLLYSAESCSIGEAFHGHDLPPGEFSGGPHATERGLSVDQHGAGATLLAGTTDFRAGQA